MKKTTFLTVILILLMGVNIYAEDIEPDCNIIQKTKDDETDYDSYYSYNGMRLHFASNMLIDYIYWSGREYIIHDTYYGGYKKTTDLENFEDIKINLNGSDEGIFNSNARSFEYYNGIYVVRDKVYDSLFQTIDFLDHVGYVGAGKHVYFLSSDFDLINELQFDVPVTALSYVDGKFYIRTQDYETNYKGARNHNGDEEQPINKIYVSDDAVNWYIDDSLSEIPIYNNGKNIIKFGDGVYTRDKGDPLYEMKTIAVGGNMQNTTNVRYENKPFNVFNVLGGIYFAYNNFADNKSYGRNCKVSLDGVYWFDVTFPEFEEFENIRQYKDMGNKIWMQTNKRLFDFDSRDVTERIVEKTGDDPIYVKLDNNILGFSQPPVMESDRILVPMRFLFEQMGTEVNWNDETQTATAKSARDRGGERNGAGENTVTFSIDNTTAYVNGAETPMDVPARLINDQTFVPLRFLSENLGYTVEWDEAANTAVITTE